MRSACARPRLPFECRQARADQPRDGAVNEPDAGDLDERHSRPAPVTRYTSPPIDCQRRQTAIRRRLAIQTYTDTEKAPRNGRHAPLDVVACEDAVMRRERREENRCRMRSTASRTMAAIGPARARTTTPTARASRRRARHRPRQRRARTGSWVSYDKRSMTSRIVITGIGVVSPFGVGRERFWEHVSRGCSGTRAITEFDASDFHVPRRRAGHRRHDRRRAAGRR